MGFLSPTCKETDWTSNFAVADIQEDIEPEPDILTDS